MPGLDKYQPAESTKEKKSLVTIKGYSHTK